MPPWPALSKGLSTVRVHQLLLLCDYNNVCLYITFLVETQVAYTFVSETVFAMQPRLAPNLKFSCFILINVEVLDHFPAIMILWAMLSQLFLFRLLWHIFIHPSPPQLNLFLNVTAILLWLGISFSLKWYFMCLSVCAYQYTSTWLVPKESRKSASDALETAVTDIRELPCDARNRSRSPRRATSFTSEPSLQLLLCFFTQSCGCQLSQTLFKETKKKGPKPECSCHWVETSSVCPECENENGCKRREDLGKHPCS